MKVVIFLIFALQIIVNYVSAMEIAEYQEIKDLPNHPEKLLIDVRGANEIKETGSIPTSINIPLSEVEDVLTKGKDTFKTKFGREFPKPTDAIIFSCKQGGGALKAATTAEKLGYKNVKYYKGSWQDWVKQEGLKQ